MLLSMTGYGEAHRQGEAVSAAVEVRTVNSRYFKLALRVPEGYGLLEPQIEGLVRQQIRRGTVQVTLRVDRSRAPDEFGLNLAVLERYREQLETIRAQWQLHEAVHVEALLPLPGVVHESTLSAEEIEGEWPLVAATLTAALQSMARMRADEGQAMAADLASNLELIASRLAEIESRAPEVAQAYRARLADRIGRMLAEFNVSLAAGDLVREVGLFAERCDISEEIVRLRSHLAQFRQTMEQEESAGRKLDFLIQEMSREANTIGSKANDVPIARQVIEIKTCIERMREMIQNVE